MYKHHSIDFITNVVPPDKHEQLVKHLLHEHFLQ